tara:strand:+ start:143 stop:412 length:270 start_codon:yes stop_codon:yes gene_type:complete
MKANLQQLEEMQEDLFRQQCDLDIQKAMVKHFIKKKEDELLTLTDVSQRSELLPDFLYEDDGIIKVGVHGDSAVTDEWNDYLKKLGNCG